VYAEIAVQAADGLRVEGHVHRHDVAVSADGDEYRASIVALELEPQLHMTRGRRPGTWYRSGNPLLIRRIPKLPDAVSERALDGEVIPLAIDDLVGFILDAKRGARIFHGLIERKNEVRG